MPVNPALRVPLCECVLGEGSNDSEGPHLTITSHYPILSGPWRHSFPSPKWSQLCHQSLLVSVRQPSSHRNDLGIPRALAHIEMVRFQEEGRPPAQTNRNTGNFLKTNHCLFFHVMAGGSDSSSGDQNLPGSQGSQVSPLYVTSGKSFLLRIGV